MCVAILMVVVIAWAMISGLFGIADEISSSVDASVDGDVVLFLFGRLLMCLGIVFYFAWVAFPTMERSFGETGPWNTPNGMLQNRPGYPPQNGYPPVGYPGQARSMPATPPLSSPVASGIIRTASGSTLEFLQSVRTVCNGCGQEMICGEYRVIMPDGYNSRIAYYCDSCVSQKTTQ